MKSLDINAHTAAEANELIKSEKPVIMLYHWSMCGHCTEFMPTWNEFAKNCKSATPCNVEYSNIGALPASLREVRAFPTIQMIVKGRIRGTYMGDRSIASLNNFVATAAKPPAPASAPAAKAKRATKKPAAKKRKTTI